MLRGTWIRAGGSHAASCRCPRDGGHPVGWLLFALALGGSDRLPVALPQGDYDQSKTKVLHLSLNPAGAARQRLREDQQQLQEECVRLRELVRALEAGGPVTAHLEAAAGLPSSREVAGRPRSFHPSLRPACAGAGPRASGGWGPRSAE